MSGSSPRRQMALAGMASALLYVGLLFFCPRTDFLQLMAWFAGLFLLYGFFIWKKEILPLQGLLLAAIGFRLLAALAMPELSDDYFRFIWDGRLLAHGVNPFVHLPSEIEPDAYSSLGLSQQLFAGLNSPDYFTIYPPLCQAVFGVAALLSPGSTAGAVGVMKFLFLLAEAGSILVLRRLLNIWKLEASSIVYYALNPLVIVELCGNLHFEAFMIFFLLLTLLALSRERTLLAALPFALAVCSKLLPLVFLPLLPGRMGWLRAGIFAGVSGLLILLAFMPLFDTATLMHLLQSIELYFRSFEFNASIYYLVREIGFQFVGYNIIGTAGPVLAGITFLGILWIAARETHPSWQSLPRTMLWVLLLYFGLATTVHPWYICSLVALSALTRYRFPLVWSALIPLTYAAYQTPDYRENFWLLGLEYGLLLLYFVFEVRKNRTKAFPHR